MPVYVDALKEHLVAAYHGDEHARRVGARNGHLWCHLYADTEKELHRFARLLGLKRAWAQVSRRGQPHYDLTPLRRTLAVKYGAIELERAAVVRLLRRLRTGRAV